MARGLSLSRLGTHRCLAPGKRSSATTRAALAPTPVRGIGPTASYLAAPVLAERRTGRQEARKGLDQVRRWASVQTGGSEAPEEAGDWRGARRLKPASPQPQAAAVGSAGRGQRQAGTHPRPGSAL